MSKPVLSLGFDVPFSEAIAWAKDRISILPDTYYTDLPAQARSRAFTISGLSALDQIQGVLDNLNKTLETGGTFAEWRKNLKPEVLALGNARLDNIFRTGIQTHYNIGRYEQQEANKAHRPYRMYDAINDGRTRPHHKALDNFIAPISDPIWGKIYPPNGFRCLLPGTMVQGDFRIGLKSWYSGKAIEMITRSGVRLAVTANHPVLTKDGFIAAQHIKCGDKILSNSNIVKSGFKRIINNDHTPASVEDVFDALSLQALGVAEISPLDFHGDAQFGKGYVDVAGSDGVLTEGFSPKVIKRVKNRALVWGFAVHVCSVLRSKSSALLNFVSNSIFPHQPLNVGSRGSCDFGDAAGPVERGLIKRNNPLLKFIVNASSSLPCSAALALNKCAVFFYFLPFKKFSLRSTSWLNTVFNKYASNNASDSTVLSRYGFFAHAAKVIAQQTGQIIGLPSLFFNWLSSRQKFSLLKRSALNAGLAQETLEKAVTDSRLFEYLSKRNAGDISVDEVVSVRDFTFSGHVYDFQTDQGWMIADGIIISNCRCSTITLTEAQAVQRGYKVGNLPDVNGGADKGWDYNPATGQDAKLDQIKAQRLAKVDADILAAAEKALKESAINTAFVEAKTIAEAGRIGTRIVQEI